MYGLTSLPEKPFPNIFVPFIVLPASNYALSNFSTHSSKKSIFFFSLTSS